MKNISPLIFLSTLILPSGVSARVIYGVDNRVDVFQATVIEQKLAMSAATMISENEIVRSSRPGIMHLSQQTLKEWLEASVNEDEEKNKKFLSPKVVKEIQTRGVTFCDGEKFVNQPNPGMCSGFLIAPDLIATAGHCAELPTFCSEYRWVFDFKVDKDSKTAGLDIKEENIYKCKKVVSGILSRPLGLDYAIVQLDRRVSDRAPLEFRNDSELELGAPLTVIGSPSGLPLKVASGANVRDTSHPFSFKANLDTFQGNSGSAVFNSKTGIVEGILVRGEEDFEPNQVKMCIQAKKCGMNECRGEDVSRMTSVPEIGIQMALNQAAFSGDTLTLKKLLKLNTWIDFYSKDGQSALMKAAQGGKSNSMKILINNGADINLKDAKDNTALHHLAKSINVKNAEALEILISSGANLEIRNIESDTPLLVASKNLNLIGAKLLIKAKANLNVRDTMGETILFPFVRKGDFAAVNELISLGVDASIKNHKGFFALDCK